MGYIAGVIDKKGEDTSDLILKMLKVASRGQAFTYGIGNNLNTERFKEIPEFTSISSPAMIGQKNVHVENPESPINQGSTSHVFNGMLYDSTIPDGLEVANLLEQNPLGGIRELIEKRVGAYTVATVSNDEILCGIDHIGTIPLYYGESADHYGVASNKRMLQSIEIQPIPLEPGSILKLSRIGIEKTRVRQHQYRTVNQKDENATIEKIDELFTKVSDQLAKKPQSSAIAFSGGVDSTIIAQYLKNAGLDPILITTGLEGQKELDIAVKAADHLDLEIDVEGHTESDVEELLDEIIRSVEEPNPMMVGIAYPFYWSAKNAYDRGCSTLYSGNGADELFGGYKRYHSEYLKDGKVSKMIFEDVSNSWRNNFHRDTKTCLDQGVSLVLPFAHPEIIDYGLTIPASMKLSTDPHCIRKLVLRKLAKKIGIPDEIADRPKKAAQYSTGVDKALRRIAKRRKLSIRELVETRYKEINRE